MASPPDRRAQRRVTARSVKRGHSLDRAMLRRGIPESGSEHSLEGATASGSLSGASGEWAGRGCRTPGRRIEAQKISWALDGSSENGHKPRLSRRDGRPSEMDMMKERFARLLLGEDMSGRGNGVSSALALSNAFTNLAASVFGEQWRLEPVPHERKSRWRKERDWLLSASEHIVEFVPSRQLSRDGTNMEVMVTQTRRDLHINIPALLKLDTMLIEYLDNFKGQKDFRYISRDAVAFQNGGTWRKDDKRWLSTTVRVPYDGLSEASRLWLQHQKELVSQVLKAAMAINANVLMEMEIPEPYIESLPKNGRATLGDVLYRSITANANYFDPEEFLASVDLSTEQKILDLENRIEASVIIWKRKMNKKDGKPSWGSAVSLEKREQFEERAEAILLLLKKRFPGIPQSSLDISKIQNNKDVGHSILESYSRVLGNLAFVVMSRIEEVLHADSLAQYSSLTEPRRRPSFDAGFAERPNAIRKSASVRASDLMRWHIDEASRAKTKSSNKLQDMWNLEDIVSSQ